jgi:hypothetical protein
MHPPIFHARIIYVVIGTPNVQEIFAAHLIAQKRKDVGLHVRGVDAPISDVIETHVSASHLQAQALGQARRK